MAGADFRIRADFGREQIFVLEGGWSRFWPGADFGFELNLGLELNFVMF